MNPQPQNSSGLISSTLSVNEEALKSIFNNCSDIIFRPLQMNVKFLLIYLDGLTNTGMLEQVIIPSLCSRAVDLPFTKQEPPAADADKPFELPQFTNISYLSDVTQGILEGKVAILAGGCPYAFLADLTEFKQRSIDEPSNEASIRGPREAFTETLRTNTSLIRRKIKSPSLKFEAFQVGTKTNTQIMIAYVDGTVDTNVLVEVKKRLGNIKSSQVFDSSYIEEYIEDSPFSVFPQIMNTERPDTVAACLMEGKVAILTDGSPNALIVPMTFWSGFQSAEDHYERFIYVTAVRLVRFLLVAISLLLPSVYVALTTFHPQMIPLNLMMSIAASREGIPFPTVVETFLMEMMFEGLREAGLRLP
ncbi:MAG: GerA spore germination protein, partial [Paenibacillus sp.]|nr:GerA spore germination protein [Paenibacillus sp.]